MVWLCRLKPASGVASMLSAVPSLLLPLLLVTALGLWMDLAKIKSKERKCMNTGNNSKNWKTKLGIVTTSMMKTTWAVGTGFCGSCLLT